MASKSTTIVEVRLCNEAGEYPQRLRGDEFRALVLGLEEMIESRGFAADGPHAQLLERLQRLDYEADPEVFGGE